MKQNVALSALYAGLLCLVPLVAQKTSNSAATTHSVPDARRLRTGTFTYHDLDHGKEVGKGTISSQRWEAIATSRFDPGFGEACLRP